MTFPNGNLNNLFMQGYQEILHFFLYMMMILLIMYFTQKTNHWKQCIFAGIIIVLRLIYIFKISSLTSSFNSLLLAAFLVLTLRILNLLKLTIADQLFLYSMFFIPHWHFNSSYSLLGYGVWYLIIMAVLFLFGKVKEGSLKTLVLSYYISFIYLAINSFFYIIVSDFLHHYLRYQGRVGSIKFFCAVSLLFVSFLGSTYLLRKLLQDNLSSIYRISRKYKNLDKIVFDLISAMVLIILLLPIPFVLTRTFSNIALYYLSIFYLLLLSLQVLFIYMFYKITEYKETLSVLQETHENESQYYISLEQNLENMASLRHDIKNLFLTMGRFVERSTDQEMKDFYRTKLYPFAWDEVEKNYQFSMLYQLPSETLRAFLYLKLSQAHSMKENIKLSIQIEKDDFFLGMDIIDLIRVLGILLDNAFEECHGLENSFIEISIKNHKDKITYSIKNTLRPGHQIPFAINIPSDKEGHSGLGLKITKQIVKEYSNSTLNTYYDNLYFFQSLNLKKYCN